ncbi:hypothetical protein ABPG74_005165 [Tetrahymena malaccensis]
MNHSNQSRQLTNQNDEDQKIKEYKISKRRVKINGCQTPFTIYQIISYIIFLSQGIWVFYIFKEFLNGEDALKIAYLILNGIFYSLILFFGTISSYINPIDDMITMQQKGIQIDESKKTHQCKICNLFVGVKTKHCGVCNKCIFEFDHHCEWLNNCVGSKNYKYFILLLCSLIGELLTSISYISYSLSLYNNDYDRYVQQSGFSSSCKVFMGLSIAAIIVNILCLLYCLQLVLYHAWLKIKGMSTYDHIVKNRQKQQEKLNHKIDYKKSNKEQIKKQSNLDQTHGLTNSRDQQNSSQQNKLSQNLELTSNIQRANQPLEQQLQNIQGPNPLNQTNDILLNKKQSNLLTGSHFCNNNLEISAIVEQSQDMKINFLQYSNPDEVLSMQNSQIKEYTPDCIQNKDKKDKLTLQNDTQNDIEKHNEDAQTQQTHQEIFDQVAIFHGRKIIQNSETNNSKSLRKSCSESQYKNDLENQIKNTFQPVQQKSQQNLNRILSANSKKNIQNIIQQNSCDQYKGKRVKVQPLKPLQSQQQQTQSSDIQSIEFVSNKNNSNEIIVIKQQNFI